MRASEVDFDIVVVGAGHAACEAALAAARLGSSICVVTISMRHVAEMACNPSIGGLAKGQLVREIDALGGEMGRAIDATGMQFRMLNTGKGPAVRSPRAQADKVAYHQYMRGALAREPRISVVQGRAEEIVAGETCVKGIRLTSGQEITCRAIVLTTGTFLCGRLFVGRRSWPAGRTGEPPAKGLSASLRRLGLPLGRLKTGTPPRLRSDSIDWSELERQEGDADPIPFSHETQVLRLDQVPCYLTATNKRTHSIIESALGESALFSGAISGIGPRYCPSIEDKIVRFAGRDRHRVVLEPETRTGEITYPNGLSTSLPFDVQVGVVRSIRGMGSADLTRPGYAVEYDYVDPRVLRPTLQVRHIRGLYLAGQINGTSGYEEAAAQGLVAGANAALELEEREPMVLGRDQAYIGVLIDDLVTKGADEPYRMFTSRAEHRLVLRNDNADLRLADTGRNTGLIGDEAWDRAQRKEHMVDCERQRLREMSVPLEQANAILSRRGEELSAQTVPAERLLSRPAVRLEDIHAASPPPSPLPRDVLRTVEVEIKYSGYIARARERARRQSALEERRIPETVAYEKVSGLSNEAAQKLSRVRPTTVGQAGRIPGVTPADIGVLLIHLRAWRGRSGGRVAEGDNWS